MLRKHQANARSAMAAGKSVPQAPPRLAAFFAFAEARQAANTASRSFWETTGEVASQIGKTAAQMTTEISMAAVGAAGTALLSPAALSAFPAPETSEHGACANGAAWPRDADPVEDSQPEADDTARADNEERAREARAWERFWQEEARKAAAARQRQR
jgi:hypothetical protein